MAKKRDRRFQEHRYYREESDYRTDVLDSLATRYHPWKSKTSRTWMPQESVSAVGETHDFSRARKMNTRLGERKGWFY